MFFGLFHDAKRLTLMRCLAVLGCMLLAGCSNVHVLDAPAERFNLQSIGGAGEDVEIAGTVSLVEFYYSPTYAPTAVFELKDDSDPKRFFQLLLTRHSKDDQELEVYYRMMEDGKETEYLALRSIPLSEALDAKVAFHHGIINFAVNESTFARITTPYARVAASIGVWSGRAVFKVQASDTKV